VAESGCLFRFLVRLEDNVAIAFVELSVGFLWPTLHLELLNPPHLHPFLLSTAFPCWLRLGVVVLQLLLDVGAEEGHVGVGDVDRFGRHFE